MTVLFMGTIILIALVRPDLVRQKEVADPLRERLKRLVDLLPPFVIFGIIMGSIYTGWATVTESAALAVVVALPIAAFYGRLSIRMLHDCFIATANLTAMSMLILAVAFYLNFVMGLLGVTPALGAFATSIGASLLTQLLDELDEAIYFFDCNSDTSKCDRRIDSIVKRYRKHKHSER
jgi:TRAP-type C4-dicarboxylate transport system permease large subunit